MIPRARATEGRPATAWCEYGVGCSAVPEATIASALTPVMDVAGGVYMSETLKRHAAVHDDLPALVSIYNEAIVSRPRRYLSPTL